jgi:restriction endonuclease Mrr
MAIPDFQSIMRPLLEEHEDGQEHRNRDLVAALAVRFGLTEDERREMLPSGGRVSSITALDGRRPIWSKPAYSMPRDVPFR